MSYLEYNNTKSIVARQCYAQLKEGIYSTRGNKPTTTKRHHLNKKCTRNKAHYTYNVG